MLSNEQKAASKCLTGSMTLREAFGAGWAACLQERQVDEPVAKVMQEEGSPVKTNNLINCDLPVGALLYATPPDTAARIAALEHDLELHRQVIGKLRVERDQLAIKHQVACDTIARMQADREAKNAAITLWNSAGDQLKQADDVLRGLSLWLGQGGCWDTEVLNYPEMDARIRQGFDVIQTVEWNRMEAELTALRARIKEADEQEPIAKILTTVTYEDRLGQRFSSDDLDKLKVLPSGTKLYLKPTPAQSTEPDGLHPSHEPDYSAKVALDQHSDDAAVDRFAKRMKWKLEQARLKGKGGWQDRTWTPEQISKALREHVEKGDPTDVANYCMFLAARNEGIAALDNLVRNADWGV